MIPTREFAKLALREIAKQILKILVVIGALIAVVMMVGCGEEPMKRHLVIGDSISIGYTPHLKLIGYESTHPDENCLDTAWGEARLDDWLGDGQWDLITFNFGMHDLKPSEEGVIRDSEHYEERLRNLASRLKSRTSRLVWITTTHVPRFYVTRLGDQGPALAAEHREIAERVMQELEIEVIDLEPLSEEIRAMHDNYELENDVHYSVEGYTILADYISNAFNQELLYGSR